ncbi:hypothetical protein PENARI_c039G02436 [Penicillium arizonense]|uniref:Uncharacterized protein n=1 Tax=Penicillium arizonense TaxID=1835702 RepID=A0A1F5L3U0_PENAI|nr:hypothetical protein PENARI_c039G02436 [Penicillium arizonense]OGE47640.1 hypothetical protein PENARI_c039G02436 [Penicillium arizonense]
MTLELEAEYRNSALGPHVKYISAGSLDKLASELRNMRITDRVTPRGDQGTEAYYEVEREVRRVTKTPGEVHDIMNLSFEHYKILRPEIIRSNIGYKLLVNCGLENKNSETVPELYHASFYWTPSASFST